MKLEELRQSLSSFWDSVAEGWQHLRQSAASALTGFKPGAHTNLPPRSDIDDVFYLSSSRGWSMLGGNLFEDDTRLVVRLEVPGMDKNDFDLEIQGDTLIVRGEKRFEREETAGRYRVMQCAYGSFQRIVPLPSAVNTDNAKATYINGVLRVELLKAQAEQPRKRTVTIN